MRQPAALILVLASLHSGAVVINGYARVTDIAGNTLDIANPNETAASFTAGKRVVIMQMQDNVIGSNTANNASFGDLSNIEMAGRYVIREIASVTRSSGTLTTITLTSSPGMTFNFGNTRRVQVITYERLGGGSDFTTTAQIDALAWNGNVGGVVAFEVTGILTLAHNIIADGAGFRGGARTTGGGGSCNNTTFRSNISSTTEATKGEGIYRINNDDYRKARGKVLNGGGGGNSHNAGGGGGGNFRAGGNGGNGWGCSSTPAGGIGGIDLSGQIAASRLFMGGGGGGGEGNNSVASDGGNGGGIILIKANAIRTSGSCGGGRVISANGVNAPNATGNDGAGGGGAGGSIYLSVPAYNIAGGCQLTVRANGGNGGAVNTSAAHGGGGGGGQGVVLYSIAQPTTNITTQAINGTSGCDNNTSPCTSMTAQPGAGSNGAGIIPDAPGPLPVELLSFKALVMGNQAVRLEWVTATERDNAFFTVERSLDLDTWNPVVQVVGAGNSQEQLSYWAMDEAPPREFLYYRLRQTDLDGTSTLSDMATVDLRNTSTAEPVLFPNPAQGIVHFSFPEALEEGVSLVLIDPAGREIRSYYLAGGQTRYSADLSGVPAGLYRMQIISNGRISVRSLLVSP
ncbi:MAG: T9SS type A sorting domain-containing protein [Flavobacteriales bacterium]|nr:T9SS type A sorting domain-containing protein [Flavobacteriales bacterium]